ncbi:MAG: hypothetical protein AMXMBFR66_01570 [Pseudomonadota bacterium]|nr:hypothetical protein [Rubrivivax sp.]NLZ41637.1 hypothetical protein [Comamonadaceae bacterium]
MERIMDGNGMRRGLVAVLLLVSAATANAQKVEYVYVTKAISYLQTSATDVVVDPAPPSPGYGGPYWFWADVEGQNLESIAPPTFSGPVNPAISGWYNGGVLKYNQRDEKWRAGRPGNDFGAPTFDNLNSNFGNGTYSFSLLATGVSLSLAGDLYGNTPKFTLTGGTWSGGIYVIDVAKPLTLTTNAYAGYGTHVDDFITAWLEGGPSEVRLHSRDGGSNVVTLDVPAFTMVSGRTYRAGAAFGAISDEKAIAGLDGALAFASYNNELFFTISAVPELSTLFQSLLGTALLGGWLGRQRARSRSR